MHIPEDTETSDARESQPILLAGVSVRAAAESARRAGFSVIACDSFGDRETIRASRRWIDRGRTRRLSDQCGPIAFTSGFEDLLSAASFIHPSSTFLHASPQDFAATASVGFLQELAKQAGVHFPESTLQPPKAEGWLEKRCSRSGGTGVGWAGEGSSGRSDEPRYFQRFVSGRVFGVTFLSDGNRAILVGICHSIHKRFAECPFLYVGSFGPVRLDANLQQDLHRLGQTLVQQTGLTGPLNIDVIVRHGDVVLLEVNPRWSASMEIVEAAWSDQLTQTCSLFEAFAIWEQRRTRYPIPCGRWRKRYVFASADTVVEPASYPEFTEQTAIGWKDVSTDQTSIHAGEPLATLIADLTRVPNDRYRKWLGYS